MEGVQFLHAATTDRHGGVGQPDGPALGPPGAAGGGAALLAGQGSAAAGAVAHRLGHAHLAVGELVSELMILKKRPNESACNDKKVIISLFLQENGLYCHDNNASQCP